MAELYSGRASLARLQEARAGKLYPTFKAYQKMTLTHARKMDTAFLVETIEGLMTGKAGDYLAIGAHGEMYPIDDGVFTDTYEEV